MINVLPQEKALGCFRHPQPVAMKQADGTEKDGTLIRHLFCPRCYCTLPLTAELQRKLEDAISAETPAGTARP